MSQDLTVTGNEIEQMIQGPSLAVKLANDQKLKNIKSELGYANASQPERLLIE